jgi:hypothetical protein
MIMENCAIKMEEGRFVLEREANGRRQISRELQLSALKGLGGSLFAGVRRKVRWTDKPRLGSALCIKYD